MALCKIFDTTGEPMDDPERVAISSLVDYPEVNGRVAQFCCKVGDRRIHTYNGMHRAML